MAGLTTNVDLVPRTCSCSPPMTDWRKNCPGVNSKLKHLLDCGLLTDVSFRVGSEVVKGKEEVETIRAHKFMLAMFSSVFEAMFMGSFMETNCSPGELIKLPDIHPSAFKTLLEFIYVGELDKNLTTADALGTLYAAKKYDISELEIECLRFLKEKISVENAVTIFQAAQMFEEKELRDEAQAFLRRNFDTVMKNEDFLNISIQNLKLFVKDDDTFASELAIFKGVLRWAESECQHRLKISASKENMRGAIGDLLFSIRFPVIPSEDIALEVVPAGILNLEECTLLLQYKVVSPNNRGVLPALPFSDERRSFSAYKVEFYDEMKGMYVDLSAGWYNTFSVDQPISVVSFGFYGPHGKDNASYNVEIKITKDDPDSENTPTIAEAKYQCMVVKRREIFHVKFPHPVPVQPKITYRAWFSLTVSTSSFLGKSNL